MEIKARLVREILIWCEKNLNLETTINPHDLKFSGFNEEQIQYHIVQLVEAGYIDAIGYEKNDYRDLLIKKLSWNGHLFLDLVRNETYYKKLVTFLGKAGIQALPVILEYLKPYVIAVLGNP